MVFFLPVKDMIKFKLLNFDRHIEIYIKILKIDLVEY